MDMFSITLRPMMRDSVEVELKFSDHLSANSAVEDLNQSVCRITDRVFQERS